MDVKIKILDIDYFKRNKDKNYIFFEYYDDEVGYY